MVYFYVVIFLPLVRVAKFAPITSIIQLRVFIFSLSQYENNHILCFNDCGLPPPVQIRRKTRKKKTKKQHLVTPAMLPPHGFSIFL